MAALRGDRPAVILLDVAMPRLGGLEALPELKRIAPDVPVIMCTAYMDVPTAVRAMQLGAYDYLTKPFDPALLILTVRRALERQQLLTRIDELKSQGEGMSLAERMGGSGAIESVIQQVAQVARSSFTVLIQGETGTGKELVARAIHNQGPRRDKPFVAVALGLTYLAVRRYARLSGSLESEVAAQTRDLRTQQEQLGALVRAGQVVMAGLDLQTVLTGLIGEASRISGAPHMAVLLRDEGSRTLRLAAQVGDVYPPGHELAVGQGSSGLVAERGEPICVPDVSDDSHNTIPERDRDAGVVAYLGLPIKAAGTVLGVLAFKTVEPRRFDPEELAILTSLAHQAAIAIENARLYAHLEEHVRDLKTVTRLNQLISSSLESGRVLSEIAQAAVQLPGAVVASIWLANEEKRTLEVVDFSDPLIAADWPVRALSFDQGVIGWVARHGRLLNVPDAFEDGRFVALDWWQRHGLRSFLGLPVILDGVLLAALTLHGREPFQLDPDEERLLESFGTQAALAIRNATLYAAEGAARQAAERALAEVRRMQGMLPICSYCKKIRNDQNSWERLESYISEHSHATFSHGICPDCRSTVVARELEQWRRAS